MKTVAIIVAGGKGTRMHAGLPKQFLLLAGKPVLFYSLEAFFAYDPTINLFVVLPAHSKETWLRLIENQSVVIPHTLIEGGKTRYHSVKNGLQHVEPADLIAIHDGARPLLSPTLIQRVTREALLFGNAIPAIPVPESMRKITHRENHPVTREQFRLIQTPQVFHACQIQKAYLQPYQPSFTDDATVLEMTGEPVHLVEGDPANIKITLPSDLTIAEALLTRS